MWTSQLGNGDAPILQNVLAITKIVRRKKANSPVHTTLSWRAGREAECEMASSNVQDDEEEYFFVFSAEET